MSFNEITFNDLSNTIYNVLNKYKNELENSDSTKNNSDEVGLILSNKNTLMKLLEEDDINENDTFFIEDPSCKDIFNYKNASFFYEQLKSGNFYYPPKPHHKHISLVLMAWASISKFPIQFNPLYGLREVVKSEQEKDNITFIKNDNNNNSNNNNVEQKEQEQEQEQKEQEKEEEKEDTQKVEMKYFENLNEKVVLFLNENWNNNEKIMENEEKKNQFIFEFFKNLSNRNLLTMFGIRKTKLSLDTILLPGPIQLIKSSNLLHSPPPATSKLTVSSRALSKHGIRSKDSFWGSDKGPELVKNKRSEAVLIKILKEPTWINIHLLPHDIKILEIRNQQGYGLRWTADGCFFRGFLEPQMEGGHEIGWRH
ncbi:hypothetical protein DDB_G0284457 [Dictyostelium discoideum AX4]|uniref:Uncharacterized protein n=1 Tax=Dictyostelium discoideum TaxID=44689 RepID=Q54PN4_DICDI|nr:hypothetical protein DDB_G0284457 [Dictyostelium discoideum AX4]EAL65277.1 hypothetical protein DDB_G0284457 [Dictyostelium discoideum AX4]|eukprot:XP_638620.1 hypothetical protein DDB_G0284457 [Dictyostelium discoideum AX4]